MPKKSAKSKSNASEVMRTLIIDNGSKYVGKIRKHVEDAAKEQNINHETQTITTKQLKDAYDSKDTDIFKGTHYVISSGSPKRRQYDTELHRFIADNLDDNAVFLGVCHGAQQYAEAHGATLKNAKYMHRGKREAIVRRKHETNPVLENTVKDGSMQTVGHHQYYIEKGDLGSDLEEIATATSKHTKKDFVEMYKRKGKEHYGVQFHPEEGDGRVIWNLFKRAYEKSGIGNAYKSPTPGK
jgi:anthranilate/para-aminobenzoate synthase component II